VPVTYDTQYSSNVCVQYVSCLCAVRQLPVCSTSVVCVQYVSCLCAVRQLSVCSTSVVCVQYVGCGPVAWAQIFGFYDRRAHAGVGRHEPQALYECGNDGVTGATSCQAPATINSDSARIHSFITKMHDYLGYDILFIGSRVPLCMITWGKTSCL
jgi:hypothetical protein